MSISPSLNHGSASSSSSLSTSQSSTSNHGFICRDPSQSHQTLPISDSPSSLHHHPGPVAPGAQYSVEPSKEVKVSERPNHGKSSIHQDGDNTMHPEDASCVPAGPSKQKGKSCGLVSPSNHQAGVSSSPRTGSGHSWKKSHMVSGNHLLNFHYNPIPVSRPQSRAPPPPRRQQKRKPYNKDLFLQANYKFVVLDSGDYTAESMDPDKMLCWEDIIYLKYSSPFPVQCPICLDVPLCPQITSCGHIFCFPCILQYFSIEDDLKGESWKKCPLCFTMISSKDLYTIYIENVKQYHIGDEIEFVLLTRHKGSYSSSTKNNGNMDIEADIIESFSKFTLTSDVELSVREAISDLDSWIARADSGLVDDIEKLPYVCAAMEQLKHRKKYWNTRSFSGNRANSESYGSPQTEHIADINYGVHEFSSEGISCTMDNESNSFGKQSLEKLVGESFSPQVVELNESLEDQDRSSCGVKKDEGSYNFYQAVDGQHIILHPLNMKCLLHHYDSYEKLPDRISGKILQMETVTQSEATRRRYRFLSHFSLTTTFQLCEISFGDLLPAGSLSPFMDEIKNREKQRKRLARKEHKDKIKAEAADNHYVPVPYYSYDATPSFSMDDFEALGSPPVASSGHSAVMERLSFSNVARLGFAAAYDSPALKTDETKTTPRTDVPLDSSNASGRSNISASFADITSRAKDVQDPRMNKPNEAGKKGKKSSRVLLSTSGGRRY